MVGSCLLLRSSTASQCKSSSTLELLTAFSMKQYSLVAFLILRPQGLQTRSNKFSLLVNGNPIERQQWAKLSPALSTLHGGENKFSNDDSPPPELKLIPQNLQLLFFWTFTLSFGVAAPTFWCEDVTMLHSYESAFGDTSPREVSREGEGGIWAREGERKVTPARDHCFLRFSRSEK